VALVPGVVKCEARGGKAGLENWEIILWAVVAAVAFLGELLSVSFFLLFFALGGVVALGIALLGFGLIPQLIGFILASVLSMAVLRPALLNRLSLHGADDYESQKGITGRGAVVVESIEPGENGTVKVGSGEFWTARALYPEQRIERGSRVRVLHTDGLTALVEAVDDEGGH
jgi:membrane protein implicated in regulation of membrane protease activity